VPSVRYLDYHVARYFYALSSVIKKSARFEFLRFLGLEHGDIGQNIVSPGVAASTNYEGSILPEGHSNFGKGYKVISMYVDPEALLSTCYVLRKDGWEDRGQLYQRMISKRKIEAIRKYLISQKRVFINNIIVTLPSNTKLLDDNGNTQDISKLQKTAPVKIQLPSDYNSIGLIDGQHRVFSYYEGGLNEEQIGKLRKQQNLLVTGIVYPPGLTALKKTKFEATLFLEINSTQTNAKSDLKQAIGLLLHPFSSESIAKDVVNQLNEGHGPLMGEFQAYFFDKGKLKTTSVVSYAVKQIVKLQGNDSLFAAWTNPKREELGSEADLDLLREYISFCVKEINLYISAIKAVLPKEKWTADKKVKGRLLTTTNVNGWIICLRKIIEKNNVHGFDYYKNKFSELNKFNFSKYRSSQYGRMADDMFERFFS
jgi:DGQHR domain-containing protein